MKQGYQLVGSHSAVKTCHWVRKSLNSQGKDHCYKQRFYGIPCHRCLQMTPSLSRCTQSCLFCWRVTPEHVDVEWAQTKFSEKEVEEPESIIVRCLGAHKKALSGFGGNPNVSEEMLDQARNPIHAAISLEGEPTLYPYIGVLPDSFFRQGFKSVFIVTNGLNPTAIEDLVKEP